MSKTNSSGLNKLTFGLAVGITWGFYMLVCGWFSMAGRFANVVQNMSAFYPGFEPGFIGGVVGGIWGFIDGFVAGFLIAFFYSYFAKKLKK